MRKLYLILIAFIVNMPFNSYSYEHDAISVSLAQSDNELPPNLIFHHSNA